MATKFEEKRERWIEETRMFQRIAGVPESSREELAKAYEETDRKSYRKSIKDE